MPSDPAPCYMHTHGLENKLDRRGDILVGAKYVGSICAGLASVLPVVSGVWMSIPRNLVSEGEMDPGSIPPSAMTSVAGAP